MVDLQKMIRLVIYEDNDKLRKSLQLLFSGMSDIEVCDAFPDCTDVVNDVQKLRPDVALMDIDMPGSNGIEGVRKIKETNAEVQVIMHTIFDDDEKIFNALAAGADGYMLKNVTPTQLYEAIKDVRNGGSPMSPGVAKRVLESFRSNKKDEEECEQLTEREREILQMLTKGYTYKRISSECHITIDTTRTHIKNIYTKLHVNCGTEAVAKAMRMKLFG